MAQSEVNVASTHHDDDKKEAKSQIDLDGKIL